MTVRERAATLVAVSPAQAKRAIDDWFRRGYVMFSDLRTRSTHLRRAEPPTPAAPRKRPGSARRRRRRNLSGPGASKAS